uniref:RRM domain-containing protein n=1 Tax=Caenorhabditis japonica TaxID=281687 RepID=A0A8R1DXH6_CAEJA
MYGPYPYPPEVAEMIQSGGFPFAMMNRGMPPPQWNGYPVIHPFELHQMLRQFQQMGMGQYQQHDSPPQLRKLFIGGLSHDTTDEQLGNYFSQWGPVVDAIVIRDPNTKHSRGFGFVTFASIFSAEAAMKDRPHVLGGKTVDSKRAIPREQMSSMIPPPFFETDPAPGCKILLQGISNGTHSVDSLRIYFETFGTLDQVEILGSPRGLGFVIYEDKESAERCLAHNGGRHIVNERKIEVRVFTKHSNGSTYWKRPQQQPHSRELYEQLSHLSLKDGDRKSTGNSSSAADTPQNYDEDSNYGGTTTEDDCNAFEHEEGSSEESSAEQTAADEKAETTQ